MAEMQTRKCEGNRKKDLLPGMKRGEKTGQKEREIHTREKKNSREEIKFPYKKRKSALLTLAQRYRVGNEDKFSTSTEKYLENTNDRTSATRQLSSHEDGTQRKLFKLYGISLVSQVHLLLLFFRKKRQRTEEEEYAPIENSPLTFFGYASPNQIKHSIIVLATESIIFQILRGKGSQKKVKNEKHINKFFYAQI